MVAFCRNRPREGSAWCLQDVRWGWNGCAWRELVRPNRKTHHIRPQFRSVTRLVLFRLQRQGSPDERGWPVRQRRDQGRVEGGAHCRRQAGLRQVRSDHQTRQGGGRGRQVEVQHFTSGAMTSAWHRRGPAAAGTTARNHTTSDLIKRFAKNNKLSVTLLLHPSTPLYNHVRLKVELPRRPTGIQNKTATNEQWVRSTRVKQQQQQQLEYDLC